MMQTEYCQNWSFKVRGAAANSLIYDCNKFSFKVFNSIEKNIFLNKKGSAIEWLRMIMTRIFITGISETWKQSSSEVISEQCSFNPRQNHLNGVNISRNQVHIKFVENFTLSFPDEEDILRQQIDINVFCLWIKWNMCNINWVLVCLLFKWRTKRVIHMYAIVRHCERPQVDVLE